MKTMIVILLAVLVALVAVSPVQAQSLTDEIRPACTTSSTWLDKLLGKCIDVSQDEKTLPVSAPVVVDMEQIVQDVSDGMTKSNPVHDAAMSTMTCSPEKNIWTIIGLNKPCK